MKKQGRFIFLAAATAALTLAACGAAVKQIETEPVVYRAGAYYAEAAAFSDGWKETVHITVNDNGLISAVDWDSVSEDGGPSKKNLGDNYGLKEVSALGKEWYEQAGAMENELIEKQDPAAIGVTPNGYADSVSGCTIHVNGFVALADKALAEARQPA